MVASDVVEALRTLPCGPRLLAAAGSHSGLWLVGGAVRDLLLGRIPAELDIAVEGDVEPVARSLGGSCVVHERFGTATVETDGCRFDFARTRTERYSRPGALPEVAWAAIDADLLRRDVTINAIAVALPGGEVRHAPGALDDLRAGRLAVLHEQSLRDDPTRLWRIARYGARLGFDVDERTARQAKVLERGAVSGERIGSEVRLALAEQNPPAVFERVAALCPGALPDGFTARPAPLTAALAVLPQDGRRDLTILAACTQGVELGLLQRWLDDLQFPASERDLVAAASRWVTGAPLRAASGPVEIARAARGAPVEAIALAGGAQAKQWIDELRHVRLEISGDDLVAAGLAPGPQVGEGLALALEAKLAGATTGREDELAVALQRAPS